MPKAKGKVTREWRVCWNSWRRTVGGRKIDTVITCNAADEAQARQFQADNPDENWVECREVTEWRRVT